MYWNFIYEYIHWTLLFWSISHIIIPNYFVDFRKIWLLIYLLDCYEYIWIYTMNFISFNVVGNSCHFIVTDKIIYRLLLVYAICTVWYVEMFESCCAVAQLSCRTVSHLSHPSEREAGCNSAVFLLFFTLLDYRRMKIY